MAGQTTTSPFFNNFNHGPSKDLLDKLVTQAIQVRGMDMLYLPRTRSAEFDDIFHEDAQSSFVAAHQIPIYIKTADGFSGQEALMTQFGIESRLQLVLTIARAQWETNIIPANATLYQPREGDLIQITAFDHRIYEIKFVDEHPHFYVHGHLPQWDLTVELFEYGNELFDTGIESIDCIAEKSSINAYDWSLLMEDGQHLLSEHDDLIVREQWITAHAESGIFDTNDEFTEADTANTVIDWSEDNPYGQGNY